MVSGSRLMLTSSSPSQNQILDLAVHPESVAVLYSDRSIAVWEVPLSFSGDNPETKTVLSIPPSEPDSAGVGSVNRIEWVKKEGGYQLVVGGDQGVVFVKPETYASERQVRLDDLEKGKILKTEGVCLERDWYRTDS